MTRRIASGGAVLATVLVLSACASPASPSSSSAPSVSPTSGTAGTASTPSSMLTAALAALNNQSYDVQISGGPGGGLAGAVNPATRSATLHGKADIQGTPVDIAHTQIGTDLWAKLDLGPMNALLGLQPTKWMKLDLARLTGKDARPFDFDGTDPLDIGGLMSHRSNVMASDATHLTGTVDLAAATGVSAPLSIVLDAAGNAAKSVPFTATLDSQGRLSKLEFTPDSSHVSLEETFAFTDYGQASAITPPNAADVIAAPDAVYLFLNGN